MAGPGNGLGGGPNEDQLNVLRKRAFERSRQPSADRDPPEQDLKVGTPTGQSQATLPDGSAFCAMRSIIARAERP